MIPKLPVDPRGTDLVKIRFDLARNDTDDWPPSSTELMWARALGNGLYSIDNIPFYALGVAAEDIVRAVEVDGYSYFQFESLVESAGHGTYRVIFRGPHHAIEEPPTDELWRRLAALGCAYEGDPAYKLFAIDIPPNATKEAYRILCDGEDQGVWDFEEGKAGS